MNANHRALAPVTERRAHPRFAIQVQIELRQDNDDTPIRLQTSDLSQCGCYVELMMTLPVGTHLNATLWLNDVPVRIRALIMTSHPQYGNGIAFLKFQGDGEQLLASYLDAHHND